MRSCILRVSSMVRAELEAEIIRLQTQLDNNRMDTDTARERYELLLAAALTGFDELSFEPGSLDLQLMVLRPEASDQFIHGGRNYSSADST
jgi:hypothetical protein